MKLVKLPRKPRGNDVEEYGYVNPEFVIGITPRDDQSCNVWLTSGEELVVGDSAEGTHNRIMNAQVGAD